MCRRIIALGLTAVLSLSAPQMSEARFFGGVVYDPTNHTQNLLTAARSLEQIRNQIRQLQNEARMLRNQADNLLRLDINVSSDLQRVMTDITRLTRQAHAISYRMTETQRIFETHYPQDYADWSRSEVAQSAEFQWQTSRAAFQDALLTQSRMMEAIESDQRVLDDLLSASQSSDGNLAVQQAGNQLSALQIKQDMQVQQLMAAQYRAESLERARRLQIERESKARFESFMSGADSAYAGAN